MDQPYNQWRAMLAITKASLKTIFRSPQAVFFSLFFPVVLIVIFGALSGGGGVSFDIGFQSGSDTTNEVYKAISSSPVFNIKKGTDADIEDRLKKGRITAIVDIKKNMDSGSAYDVHLKSTSAGQREIPVVGTILNDIISRINNKGKPVTGSYATVKKEEIKARPYKSIDFYLPGMLGFSLIGASVFGVAFVFFSLRETLVLKRMYSTPIHKGYIVVGEGIGRVVFQLTTAVVLILFGRFFYDFTLANGWITFVELMALSLLGLIVFMGFGFIISSVAKNQNVIPIYANLFMFPQYFLSGTFFPKSALPVSIQPILKFLPLTALNDSMRKVSFEGLNLWQTSSEIGILLGWCVIVYAVAIKVFKWD
ncbi:MAG: ABC transporter permease [Bacteroidota bacterium]